MDIHFNNVFVFVTVQLLSVILSDEFLGEMESFWSELLRLTSTEFHRSPAPSDFVNTARSKPTPEVGIIFFESFITADRLLIIYKVKINNLNNLITLETIFF